MKHIGILAHSMEGASLCCLAAVHEGSKHLGEHNHPDITLDCMPFGPTMPQWERNDFKGIRVYLMASAQRLKKAGCDFFVLPDNTAHLALEAEGEAFPLPALHIQGVVAEAAARAGFRKIGILGTKWTMQGPLYKNAFEGKGLGWTVPGPREANFVNRIIFDELCSGIFKKETTRRLIGVIETLKGQGCDAVVLGCTELPIVITPENSPLPTLDSTRLLAKAAVEVALGRAVMPSWTGGKVFA